MRKTIALALGLALVAPAAFADSPMFRGGPRHEGVCPGPAVRPGKVKWSFRTGGKIRSTPALAGGTLAVGAEDGFLYALDAKTGALRWKFKTEGDVSSSPAIADGRVFFVGGDGALRALALADGKELWKLETGPLGHYEFPAGNVRTWDYFASSPVVAGGVVYVGGGDRKIHAADAATGKERWSFAAQGIVRATPAVADGVVFAGDFAGRLYALDAATGAAKWTFKVEGSRSFPNGEIQSSPAVGDGLVYFGSRDAHLYAVDAATGKLAWRASHDGSWAPTSVAIARGVVYEGSSDGKFVRALDAKTGAAKWTHDAGGRVFSSPTVAGDLLYFGTQLGDLYALELTEGNVRGTFADEAAIQSTPVVGDGLVYVAGDAGRVYAVEGPAYDASMEPKAVEIPASALSAFAGKYAYRSHSTEVRVEEEALVFDGLGEPKMRLLASAPNAFFCKTNGWTFVFKTDAAGKATGLALNIEGQTFELTRAN